MSTTNNNLAQQTDSQLRNTMRSLGMPLQPLTPTTKAQVLNKIRRRRQLLVNHRSPPVQLNFITPDKKHSSAEIRRSPRLINSPRIDYRTCGLPTKSSSTRRVEDSATRRESSSSSSQSAFDESATTTPTMTSVESTTKFESVPDGTSNKNSSVRLAKSPRRVGLGVFALMLLVGSIAIWQYGGGNDDREAIGAQVVDNRHCQHPDGADCVESPAAMMERRVGRVMQLLATRRGEWECGESGVDSPYIAFGQLVSELRRVDASTTVELLMEILRLSESNLDWQIRMLSASGQHISSPSECAYVESTTTTTLHSTRCIVRQWTWFVVKPLCLIATAVGLLFAMRSLWRHYKAGIVQRDKLRASMVDNIIALVRSHRLHGYAEGIPLGHVRDELCPHRQRRELMPAFVWACDYVLEHESRVVVKQAQVGGESAQVLLWTSPTATVASRETDSDSSLDSLIGRLNARDSD